MGTDPLSPSLRTLGQSARPFPLCQRDHKVMVEPFGTIDREHQPF